MRHLGYIKVLIKYILHHNPILYFIFSISLLSIGLEILAIASLYPIALLSSGSIIDPNSLYVACIKKLGMNPNLKTFIFIFLGLFTARFLTYFITQYMNMSQAKKIHAKLSINSFNSIINFFSVRDIEEKSAGYYIGLVGDETSRASTIIFSLMQLIPTLILTLLYFLTILKFSVSAGIAVIVFLAVCAGLLYRVFRYAHKLGANLIDKSRMMQSIFIDALNNVRAVKSYSAEQYTVESFGKSITDYTRTLFLIDFMPVVSRTGPIILLLIGLIGITFFAPDEIWTNTQPAFIATVIVLLLRFFPSLGLAVNICMSLLSHVKAAKDITAILQTYGSLDKDNFSLIDGPVKELKLSNVDFSYNQNKQIFNSFSIKFEAGNSYAIVGPSGVGKSTLCDLLMKFYHPTNGTVTINGLNYDKLSDTDIRSKVLLMGQNTTVFNDSVFKNITFGEIFSLDQVLEAAKLAEIDSFIQSLPEKYNTKLSYQGTNLSGGQKQRIGIARILVRKPDVLILDEITSALDVETRNTVVNNILRAYGSKIVIFITHDKWICDKVNSVIDLNKSLDFYQTSL